MLRAKINLLKNFLILINVIEKNKLVDNNILKDLWLNLSKFNKLNQKLVFIK